MTETRFTWRWLVVIALVGIVMGLAVGLAAGWLVFPTIGSSNVAGLSATAQNDYIVLVANTYAYDQDLTRAKQRLNQLQEKDLKSRVERLAKALAARNDPSAPNVADLAIALGSESAELIPLAEIAANDGWGADSGSIAELEPTKIARVDLNPPSDDSAPNDSAPNDAPTPEATTEQLKPRQARQTQTAAAKANQPEPTPQPEPAEETEPTAVPPTRVPATQAPTPEPTQPAPEPAPVTTEFIPSFPDKWWNAIKFIPANVAPGQQYWKLKYARYCDWAPTDNFETCPNFPAGGMGHSIYIMVVDEGGNCVTTEVNDILNDGSKHPLTPDMLKKIEFPWNPYGFACDQDYEKEMYGEGNTISVPGLPSDTITELQLCATSPPSGYNPPPCGKAHVRYFLIFQRTTR